MRSPFASGPMGPAIAHKRILCNSSALARSEAISAHFNERIGTYSGHATCDDSKADKVLRNHSAGVVHIAEPTFLKDDSYAFSFRLEGMEKGLMSGCSTDDGLRSSAPLSACITAGDRSGDEKNIASDVRRGSLPTVVPMEATFSLNDKNFLRSEGGLTTTMSIHYPRI